MKLQDTIIVETNKELEFKFNEIKQQLGNNISVGSWIDLSIGKAYVCSIDTTPGTYGHPSTSISLHSKEML